MENLNEMPIAIEHRSRPMDDHSVRAGDVAVYFRHLEENLVHLIRGADLVVGCVAWLTSEVILAALADVPKGVSIIVQKEDFLRPDVGASPEWQRSLRRQYERLRYPPERPQFGGLVGNLSQCSGAQINPVRCVGNHNSDKRPAFPRMHHKFLVFCRVLERESEADEWGRVEVTPYAVWTGSFNLTRNATLSLENAVVLTHQAIAQAYYDEWTQLLALSEPLDWYTPWCEPEWRIGT